MIQTHGYPKLTAAFNPSTPCRQHAPHSREARQESHLINGESSVIWVLWPLLKFIMGITHKITQCCIFKCAMNACKNPIQIPGYQISLNKSPCIELCLLWRLERSGLQGRFYQTVQTPQHRRREAKMGQQWQQRRFNLQSESEYEEMWQQINMVSRFCRCTKTNQSFWVVKCLILDCVVCRQSSSPHCRHLSAHLDLDSS